jgi:four helix bundle protein
MVQNYKKLVIWQLGYNLALDVYKILDKFPDEERGNIVNQLRRASASIPTNIAEGSGSTSRKVFFNHINYSYMSAKEVESLLMLSKDLGYLKKEDYAYLQRKLDQFLVLTYKMLKTVMEKCGFSQFNRPDL